MTEYIDDIKNDRSNKTAMVLDLVRKTGCQEDFIALCARLLDSQECQNTCLELTADEAALASKAPVVSLGENAISTPSLFVLEENRLYTRRYWQYENYVRSRIKAMIDKKEEILIEIPQDGPFQGMEEHQREGVKLMCNNTFSILTGGPGTGKTYTIARAVSLIQKQRNGLRLGLAAPTGKAAARVKASMQAEAKQLGFNSLLETSTIHTLLQPEYDLVNFKHNEYNKLPLDWLIVDEASMIDLPLMAKLLAALPEGCKLTLVGDAHQLASVDAGRVFGDLCQMKGVALCALTESRRFPKGGEIYNLAEAVNNGESDKAMKLLENKQNEKITYHDLTGAKAFSPKDWEGFDERLCEYFAPLLAQKTPEGALADAVLNNCRILCALRNGPYGVKFLNKYIQDKLGRNCPVPMMITKNDKALEVNNGDVGVIMPNDRKNLYLANEDGSIRKLPLELLSNLEMAFAATVHKSQGSEYRNVIILLPPALDDNDANAASLMTREILYTAITRTKDKVIIYGGKPTIKCCCKQRIQRCTGLCNSEAHL